MNQKKILRKKYYIIRKKNYYEVGQNYFSPLIKIIKSNFKNKDFKLAAYFPSNFELNVLKFLENKYVKNQNILLPAIEKKII
jgi:5-formyltetrahydrofolate cyclo-ligase